MKQLDIFTLQESELKIKLPPGRPTLLTSDLVLLIIEDIKKKKMSNIAIMQKHNVKQRTFYRIRKGDYSHLLQEAIEISVDNFSLQLTDE